MRDMDFEQCAEQVIISWEDFNKTKALFAVEAMPMDNVLRCDFEEDSAYHHCHVTLLGLQVFTDKEGRRRDQAWWVSWGPRDSMDEYVIFQAPMCDEEENNYTCNAIMNHPGKCELS